MTSATNGVTESRQSGRARSSLRTIRHTLTVKLMRYRGGTRKRPPTTEVEGPFQEVEEVEGLAEEGQDARRSLVRLSQDRLASLLQNARLGEVHHLSCHIHVADAALGCGQVLLRHTQVRDRVLQAVLRPTQAGSPGRTGRPPLGGP